MALAMDKGRVTICVSPPEPDCKKMTKLKHCSVNKVVSGFCEKPMVNGLATTTYPFFNMGQHAHHLYGFKIYHLPVTDFQKKTNKQTITTYIPSWPVPLSNLKQTRVKSNEYIYPRSDKDMYIQSKSSTANVQRLIGNTVLFN